MFGTTIYNLAQFPPKTSQKDRGTWVVDGRSLMIYVQCLSSAELGKRDASSLDGLLLQTAAQTWRPRTRINVSLNDNTTQEKLSFVVGRFTQSCADSEAHLFKSWSDKWDQSKDAAQWDTANSNIQSWTTHAPSALFGAGGRELFPKCLSSLTILASLEPQWLQRSLLFTWLPNTETLI